MKMSSEKIEAMKVLCRLQPEAKLLFIRQGVAYYEAVIDSDTTMDFQIPVSDMGDTDFHAIMNAKLFARWFVA
jgi:hypothetical protein